MNQAAPVDLDASALIGIFELKTDAARANKDAAASFRVSMYFKAPHGRLPGSHVCNSGPETRQALERQTC